MARRPRSKPSTSRVVSAYASRKSGSPKFAHWFPKPPTKPFTPAMPTLTPCTGSTVCERSSTTTPASESARARSAGRSDCQSWLPRTATTGIARSRHASATTHTSSTWPCWVRSPASSTRSACSSTRLNASRTRSCSPLPAWISPAAATRIVFTGSSPFPPGTAVRVASEFETLLEGMRKAAGILRDSGIPFALAGGLASYACGGPQSDHDVDFFLKREDAARALDLLGDAGFRCEKPPEGWLYKVYDDKGAMIDLIFAPNHGEVTDELLSHAETIEVYAIELPVLSASDVLITKLRALKEHEIDYEP